MPLIADPAAPQPERPDKVVSPDGWLTGYVDEPHAGILLVANYQAATPAEDADDIVAVRFTRHSADGTVAVRGGDTAPAPGGVAVVYDHEAPLNTPCQWYARPIYASANPPDVPASVVTATIEQPVALDDVWIKDLDDPGKSRRTIVSSWPDLTWTARVESVAVVGARAGVSVADLPTGPGTELTVYGYNADIPGLRALLVSGSVLLIQTLPIFARPDLFVLPGDVAESMPVEHGNPADIGRYYSLPATLVRRPVTEDQPARMPGWTYRTVATRFTTYVAITATFARYVDLATNNADQRIGAGLRAVESVPA